MSELVNANIEVYDKLFIDLFGTCQRSLKHHLLNNSKYACEKVLKRQSSKIQKTYKTGKLLVTFSKNSKKDYITDSFLVLENSVK